MDLRSRLVHVLPVLCATGILLVLAVLTLRASSPAAGTRGWSSAADLPPVIEFSWTPAGAVDLREMRGLLKITDDRGLDFASYRMELLEPEMTLDIPNGKSLIGKEYEQPVDFALIADHPRVAGEDKLTVRITVADTAGQFTTIEREIKLKQSPFRVELRAP